VCWFMLKRITGLVVICLFTLPMVAQDKPGTLLWKVTFPGNHQESYVFGTFHEVSPAFFDSLGNVLDKLRQSDVLYVERTQSDATTGTDAAALLTRNKAGWHSLLDTGEQRIFEAFVTKAEDTSYYRYSPLVLTLVLFRMYSQQFCDTTERVSNELMDTHIEQLAILQKIKSLSLDDDQVKILAGNKPSSGDKTYVAASIHLMDLMLKEDLSGCNEVADYKNMQLDYAFSQSPKTDTSILLERNNKWIAILRQAFLKKNCFVAVGFRHLFYKDGIISQLKQLGFNVTPVNVYKERLPAN